MDLRHKRTRADHIIDVALVILIGIVTVAGTAVIWRAAANHATTQKSE